MMSSPNDANMVEIPLEGDERDSIEYKILMAYAQRRLSVSKYGKLMKKEPNAQKSSSLIRRIEYQDNKVGPSQTEVSQGASLKNPSQKQTRRRYLSRYCLPSSFGREKHEKSPKLALPQKQLPPRVQKCSYLLPEVQLEDLSEVEHEHLTDETANVDHIADRLAKLVTSRSQPSPSDVSFKMLALAHGPELQDRDAVDGSKDEGKVMQTIVALLRQSGDQLEKKIKKDKTFYQHFIDMLSYTFFERVTDLILEDVSADSTGKTEGQVQCTKVAFALEVPTRLTAVDNHPMNMVLGFGIKYLREHFTPWIQNQGGWEKALTLLDQEEIE
ncbi:apoptosis facilitator Bcl-2-like protein 14 [Apteryx rowi]|uniref:apoptosis facilitator Bcl-2-like protein 14 n=1 Tax=Apteryx rowi TaxID=308060 RepID=UPI000E1E1DAF|nr:apoptosis facilitator Bcl-2-like protein 14 [Apteryx rowi]